jgi:hypothetical protein
VNACDLNTGQFGVFKSPAVYRKIGAMADFQGKMCSNNKVL